MQRFIVLLSLAFFSVSAPSQSLPLSQREACEKFSDAVVSLYVGVTVGTGFIVSVVRGEDGAYFGVIMVRLPDGSNAFAKPVSPLSAESIGQDYALLRIDTKKTLPFLSLGTVGDVAIGSDATIIGFPFSALSREGKQISTKFCLAASFAASANEPVGVDIANRTPKGVVTSHHSIQVDVVYFQGPSVKGLSGSPIISRDTGKVVGIVSTRLSGIGNSLEELKTQTAQGLGGGVVISGLAPGPAINAILTVMDSQLANGLGSATGIDDPKEALRKEQSKRK
jgi:hypothetical protein